MLKLQTKQSDCYDNCAVQDLAGRVIFRCSRDRIDWYLGRNLAVLVQEGDPTIIRLTFETKGPGNLGDPFYLVERINRCVVCGRENDLTKHHIVPISYRRFFPSDLKDYSSHDIVPLCEGCHSTYEAAANKLRDKLIKDFKIPRYIPSRDDVMYGAVKEARAILRHGERIPPDRKKVLRERIAARLGLETLTDEDLVAIAAKPPSEYELPAGSFVPQSKMVLDAYGDMQAFVFMWREHFISTMAPKFMPPYWDAGRTGK